LRSRFGRWEGGVDLKYFSVPADFKAETIDEYRRLNQSYSGAKVIETYGQITTGNAFEAGRAVELLPEIDLADLAAYLDYSREKGIDFSYTINAPYMRNREFTREGILEIRHFLGTLYQAGVRSLTVALPSLMELIKALPYDFKIKVSTICQVVNANMAWHYQKMGLDRLVVGESINRDFQSLKSIVDTYGPKVEVIANSICHSSCPNRMFHYNEAAGDSYRIVSPASVGYYPHRCMLKRYEKPENVLKLSWIRPEDLEYYAAVGINYFKLQGRQMVVKGDPVRTVESYFNGYFDGNLLELLEMFAPTNSFRIYVDNRKLDGFLKPFFDRANFCKNDCANCHYCEATIKKCVDLDRTGEIIKLANDFYTQYDPFTNLVNSLDLGSNGAEPEREKVIEFQF
jgi:collagenase-like PrtC family protease